MPIKNIIDDKKRIVYTICEGKMHLSDFDVYIKRVWGDAVYYGYNEIFDTRLADWDDFDFSSLFAVANQSSKTAALAPNSKVAFVVHEGKQKALTDFYTSARTSLPGNSRLLRSFFSEEQALAWLAF